MKIGDTTVSLQNYVIMANISEILFESPFVFEDDWVCKYCGEGIHRPHTDTCFSFRINRVKKELNSLLEYAGYSGGLSDGH